MVLESLVSPFKAEQKPVKLLFLGAVFCSIAILLSLWIFKSQASLIMVFLISMAALPLVFNTIKMEEEKDLEGMEEKWLLKEHVKALKVFMYLFIGVTVAFSFWYLLLPSATVTGLFQSQTATINAINGRVTGHLGFSANMGFFSKIFLNNVKVLIFCILFSFVYGSGAIFILMWNASVIGTAIGNFMRSEIAKAVHLIGFEKVAHYFQVISLGLLRYSIHGIPEILAYFVGGLAGGIIGIAIIKHDFGTNKFEHILLDSADLLLLSLGILFIAAILEVFVTPAIF
ncbi:MAG: stage II sporulation protein M [Nanoarchaeota archaeon]|nr:stage II sporulation protein M [Nanoarchaeota archaeon]MBU1322407.1 stage II sporulation protein M [Nanoarchaeota archaeon]MBU1598219.1 stage II sporulation protein M [Nanoarchaeota archaeon]MBU2441075.1 stage II sporulation protein M [Nanoarchaeota archaeon]